MDRRVSRRDPLWRRYRRKPPVNILWPNRSQRRVKVFWGGSHNQKLCSLRFRNQNSLLFSGGSGSCVRFDALVDWPSSL